MQTECLVAGSGESLLEVKTRFLQMVDEQGHEREVEAAVTIASIRDARLREPFRYGDRIEGEIEMEASCIEKSLFRICLQVRNCSTFADASRDQALARSLVSVHSILHVGGAEFVSLLDPPEQFCDAVEGCRNTGAWPVLAGEPGVRDAMLVSPIILYDYPQIAPESPGDLFDGTEIDEILALRILTTDDEKREVRQGDERARRILDRTETLPPEHFQKRHGALRSLRSAPPEAKWNTK
jgi:hydrogenase maturation protease